MIARLAFGSTRRRIRAAIAAIVLACNFGAAAAPVEPRQGAMLTAPDESPPDAARPWQPVTLPDIWRRARPGATPSDTWYRVEFSYTAAPGGGPWALYLPYLYDGGQVWLNGAPAARVQQSTDTVHVRWARPHLLTLPSSLLRPGTNELAVRTALPPGGAAVGFPRPAIGPLAGLLPVYERRYFWVTITPQITVAICMLVSFFVLFIWWRRRSEVLYGLFGLAVGLWGIRTLTFVIESVPWDRWLLWRLTYLGATGGFVVAMAVLALRFANIRHRWLERALVLYWLLGPLWLLAGGVRAEPLVNRYWIAGFMPIGVAIMGFSVLAVWRQRSLASAVLPTAMVLAVLAGLHDYFVNWSVGGVAQWLLPEWTDHRIFLLHYGANLVLVAMAGMLTTRFVQALGSLEALNQTLEARVAEREMELAVNYTRMAAMRREQTAAEERQLIMRELHDGLGSQLFVSLSRVERGDMPSGEIADVLRGCIADMRIALDTLSPGDNDFRSTLGDFLFRWRSQLEAAGLQFGWSIEVPDAALNLGSHACLQLLRIAQEALTNVLKHARATRVQVRLRQSDGMLELEVEDDGRGTAAPAGGGRGLNNMRQRAQQLGGSLAVHAGANGTRICLRVPVNTVPA